VPETVDDSLLTDRFIPNELLRSQRSGSGDFSYEIPVPPGRYRLVLYFAETCVECVSPALGGVGCSTCTRVFDLEYEGIRTNGINPADRALAGISDGLGATLKASELRTAAFDVTDGTFNLTLFDLGDGNPPGDPAIKGFVLLRLPPAGRTFNRPHLTVATSGFSGGGGPGNITLLAELKGNLGLVQAGLGVVQLEQSNDLLNWSHVDEPPIPAAPAFRFTVPRPNAPTFFRAIVDLDTDQ
jgi:hypothetical protein